MIIELDFRSDSEICQGKSHYPKNYGVHRDMLREPRSLQVRLAARPILNSTLQCSVQVEYD